MANIVRKPNGTYDDRIIITFNHQNGQKTISMEEANGSDFKNRLKPTFRMK